MTFRSGRSRTLAFRPPLTSPAPGPRRQPNLDCKFSTHESAREPTPARHLRYDSRRRSTARPSRSRSARPIRWSIQGGPRRGNSRAGPGGERYDFRHAVHDASVPAPFGAVRIGAKRCDHAPQFVRAVVDSRRKYVGQVSGRPVPVCGSGLKFLRLTGAFYPCRKAQAWKY